MKNNYFSPVYSDSDEPWAEITLFGKSVGWVTQSVLNQWKRGELTDSDVVSLAQPLPQRIVWTKETYKNKARDN